MAGLVFGLPVALAVSKSNYLLSLKPTGTPSDLFVCSCIMIKGDGLVFWL